MEIVNVQRTYTEDGVTYVFRDIVDEDGNKRVQHLVKEPWGEEFWNDNEPAENEVLGARPYDQTEHAMERVGKMRVRDVPASEEADNEDDKTERKAASPRKAHAKKA